MFQPAAAGDLHPHDGHALDVVAADDLRQLLGVIHAVQLRAAHQRDMPLDEPLMEGGVGVGRAVGSNEQLGPVKIRRPHRDQLDLHRPLGQPADRLGADGLRLPGLRVPDASGLAPRTSAGQGSTLLPHLFLHLLLLIGQHRLLVIGGCLPLHKGDGPGGTGRQTVPQPVAVVVPHQLGLALYHGDGPLMTGLGAGAAAVAFLPVDFNDPSFHDRASLFF